MRRSLTGRGALITGASRGLGLAIARAYVEAGANVMLCARDAATLESARCELTSLAQSGQVVAAQPADISRPEDVSDLAAAAMEACAPLHVLVNNAAVLGPIGPIESVAWDEWVQAVAINLIGSVLMCRALLPHFKAQRYGKIIELSGGGATKPMPGISAYAATKAAVVRFAETLAGEVQGHGIDVNCLAPGALNTRFVDQVISAGPTVIGEAAYAQWVRQKTTSDEAFDRPAALAVFLASAASDGLTGKLLSAVWDPWETLDQHRTELAMTDIYTLRRIVPADRGFKWGGK